MIPARPGHTVRFERGDVEPVVAWDDDGGPLIAGTCSLVNPNLVGSYRLGWERVSTHAFVAHPGWRVRFTNGEPPGSWTSPVIAWAFDNAGGVRPIVHDDEFETIPADDVRHVSDPGTTWVIVPPSGEDPTPVGPAVPGAPEE